MNISIGHFTWTTMSVCFETMYISNHAGQNLVDLVAEYYREFSIKAGRENNVGVNIFPHFQKLTFPKL